MKTVNAEMIVLARESRGLTQGELADAIGVSQGKVSKYENGLLQVSHEDLEKIAKHLGYTTDFFFQTDRIYGLGSSLLFHRQRQDVPLSVQRKIQAEVNVSRMQIERLLRGAEVESTNRFEPIDVDSVDGDVAHIAQLVRSAWQLPLGPIRNMTHAVESAGGIILKCDFGTKNIDAAHLWVPGMPPLFFMNQDVPADRFMFTLAHEVGHAIMHRLPTGDIEDEANRFAAEFLMPKAEIGPQLDGITIEKAARLKPHWRVSMAAIIKRARDLDKITDRQYRSLFTRLSALGYRKNEPIALQPEEPTIVPQLVAVYQKSFGYGDDDVARMLFSRRSHFFKVLENVPLNVKLSDPTYPFLRYKNQA